MKWIKSLTTLVSLTTSLAAFAADTIEDMTWRLIDLNKEGVVKDSIVTLEFEDKKKISGRAGCNSYFGSYTLDDARLKINANLGSTMAACEDKAMMLQEKTFLKLLSEGINMKANEDLDKMVITTSNGDTLTFEGVKKVKTP